MIDKFEGEYACLSNFYPSPIEFFHPQGGPFQAPTVEHAYQALKTTEYDEYVEILEAPGPGRAKLLGRKATIRPDWEDVKVLNMGILVRLKFTQNPDLARVLLLTGRQILVEGNTWHDNFWGVCDCNGCFGGAEGKNNLGKILMNTREELRNG